MDDVLGFMLSIFSGVIVSLVALWLAGRQRAKEEHLKEARYREAILASIGRELQWNRTATRSSLDASNAHYMIGRLTTVAFERHGADLAAIAPESVEAVFKHYSTVSVAREGIRALAGVQQSLMDETQPKRWIESSDSARRDVSNTASKALKKLGLPIVE